MAKKSTVKVSAPKVVGAGAPKAPAAPSFASQVAKAPTPAPAPAPIRAQDPRDSSYWAQLTNLHDQRTKKLGDIDKADAYANTDHDDSTRKLIESHAKDMMAAKQAQNSRGLFYSTFASNQNRDLDKSAADQQGAYDEAWRRVLASNQSARDQINLDYGDGSDANVGSLGTSFLNEAIARAVAAAQTQDAPPTSPVAGDPTPYTPFTSADAAAVLKHAIDTSIVPAAKAALKKKKKG